MPALFLAGRDHVDDVGMVELAQRLALAQEAFEEAGVVRQGVGVEGLDRDGFAGVRVGGAVDLAHPPAAEQVAVRVFDPVAIGNLQTLAHVPSTRRGQSGQESSNGRSRSNRRQHSAMDGPFAQPRQTLAHSQDEFAGGQHLHRRVARPEMP